MNNSTDEVIMLASTAPNQQYVLSLDSLDSNFVSQYAQKTPDAVKPLWSKSKMDGEYTFCQVELVAENLKEHDQNFAVPPTRYIKCHICNVCVPKSHYKKHIKTERHQLYTNLTERILRNAVRQIEVHADLNSQDDPEDKNDEYYCESCSKIISLDSKQQHDQSIPHLRSIENINITKRFFKRYSSSTGWPLTFEKDLHKMTVKIFKLDMSYESETDDSISTTSITSTSYTEFGVDDSESDIEYEKISIETSASPMNNTGQETEETSYSVTSDFITAPSSPDLLIETGKQLMLCFESYLKNNKALGQKLPIIEMNHVLVETTIGFKEYIPFDAFHSYMRKSTVIYCQVCHVWLSNKEEKEHSAREVHIVNIMQPVNDNFIRETVTGTQHAPPRQASHCLLCNVIVLYPELHAPFNRKHDKYEKILQLEKSKMKKINDKTFCAVCMVDIDTHNFINHTKGNKHQKKIKNNNTPNAVNRVDSLYENILKQIAPEAPTDSTNVMVNETNLRKIFNFTTSQKNKTYCPTCDVHIDTHNFIAHTKAPKHKKKLHNSKINLPEVNKSNSARINIKSHFCNTCQVYVPKDGIETHAQGKMHRSKSGTSVKNVDNVSANKNFKPGTSKPVRGKQSRAQRKKMKELLKEEFGDSDDL